MEGFEDIERGVKKSLEDKGFIYKSKYGGIVKGVVDIAYLTYTLSSDAELGRKLKVVLGGKSGKVNITPKDEVPIDVDVSWVGMTYKTCIRSTNGVHYTLHEDELYFLS